MLWVNAPLWLQGLFTAAVTLGAGAGLFVFVLNRQLSHVEFLHKRVLLGGVLATLICGAMSGLAVSEAWLHGPWLQAYLLLPGSILLAGLIGEIRLVIQRWRYHGSPPTTREDFIFDGQRLVPVHKHAAAQKAGQNAGQNAGLANSSKHQSIDLPYRWWNPIRTTNLAVARYDVDVWGLALPEGSTGETVKVVQLSDFHYSPRLPFVYFLGAVELAMQEQADLILLTGDFVTFREDALRLPDLFEGLRGRLGIFATLGNHDYWAGSEEVLRGLRQAGVHVISNDCVRLPLWDGLHLRLCGIDDPWGKPAWQPPDFQAGDLNLIISHSSDNIYRLRQYPFTGVFSGHFHAGQVRLPGFGALVLPSRYGRRFDHGHFKFKNSTGPAFTHLFVSAGVGSAMPLLRIYCQPDIFVVNFHLLPH